MRWETQIKWNPTIKANVCAFCGAHPKIKYIATGHDHTDYEYWLCNCKLASKTGKPDHECT